MSEYSSLLDYTSLATEENQRPRIIVGIDALDKAGKTQLGFTAPKPILYMNFDIGAEGVVQKHADPRIIMTEPFLFRASESIFLAKDEKGLMPMVDGKRQTEEQLVMVQAQPVLDRFRRTYYRALREPVLRYGGKTGTAKTIHAKTIVMDTGSEVYELVRYVELGKLSQVKSHHYTAVNGMMRDFVRAAFDADVNVIWLHKLKSEWKAMGAEGKQSKTGVVERKGFEEMNYLVQANILLYRAPRPDAPTQYWKWKAGDAGVLEFSADPRQDGVDGQGRPLDLGFRAKFGTTRVDPTMEGFSLENENINFKMLAMAVSPQVDAAAWEDAI